MRFLEKHVDGGDESPVMGYWLIELKDWFSIVLLKFNPGTRENYHSHAFNAYSWFLTGSVTEKRLDLDTRTIYKNTWYPSIWPKYTPRENIHKVFTNGKDATWCLSIRGPWQNTWMEYNETNDEIITLTHGRKVVKIE